MVLRYDDLRRDVAGEIDRGLADRRDNAGGIEPAEPDVNSGRG
jgi:hypothetical protein